MHTKRAIDRREVGLKNLARVFNQRVDTIIALKRQQRYKDTIIPEKVDPNKLFKLDILDTIWNDIGLDDAGVHPDRWQSDEKVRAGILAMLELDRCKEEKERLRLEIQALRQWAEEEAAVMARAMGNDLPSESSTVYAWFCVF